MPPGTSAQMHRLLPMTPSAPPRRDARSHHAPAGEKTNAEPRILVVEDNRVHQRILQRHLDGAQAKASYRLVLEPDAEAAWERLTHQQFHLLIVDWGLPGQNGLHLLRSLRATPVHRDVPVLMQTGEDRRPYVCRALAAGADDYMVKPVRGRALRRKVDALLAEGRRSTA